MLMTFCNLMHKWATENAGMENAGLENAGPNRMGGNRRTGKRRTKIPGVEKAGLENAGTSCAWVAKHNITRIWHVPAKHANRMDARAHTSTLAECAPRFMTPRPQGFVGQSSPNLAHV